MLTKNWIVNAICVKYRISRTVYGIYFFIIGFVSKFYYKRKMLYYHLIIFCALYAQPDSQRLERKMINDDDIVLLRLL